MDWCHHLEECVRLWSVCRWLCVGVCVSVLEDSCFLGLLWSYECVSATNCHHLTLCTLTHWAVATSPQTPFFFLKRHPLTNAAPLLNDGIAPLLSLYLSSFISFSFSESERQPPPPSSLPPSFFPFPWGLCSQPSRAEPEASLSLALIGRTWPTCSPSGPPLLRYPPQLSGCSHGITLQLQWEESRGREGDRQRARESQRAQNGHG